MEEHLYYGKLMRRRGRPPNLYPSLISAKFFKPYMPTRRPTHSTLSLNDYGHDDPSPSPRTPVTEQFTRPDGQGSRQHLSYRCPTSPSFCRYCSNPTMYYPYQAASSTFIYNTTTSREQQQKKSQSTICICSEKAFKLWLHKTCKSCHIIWYVLIKHVEREIALSTITDFEPVIPYTARCACNLILLLYTWYYANYVIRILATTSAIVVYIVSAHNVSANTQSSEFCRKSKNSNVKLASEQCPLPDLNCYQPAFPRSNNVREFQYLPHYIQIHFQCHSNLSSDMPINQKCEGSCKKLAPEWGMASPSLGPAEFETGAPSTRLLSKDLYALYTAILFASYFCSMIQHHRDSDKPSQKKSTSDSDNSAKSCHKMVSENKALSASSSSNGSSGGDDEDDRKPRKLLGGCQTDDTAPPAINDEEDDNDAPLAKPDTEPLVIAALNPQEHSINGDQNPQEHPGTGALNPQETPGPGDLNPHEHSSNGDQNPQERLGLDARIPKEHSSAGVPNPPVNHGAGVQNPSNCTPKPQEHYDTGALNLQETPGPRDLNPHEHSVTGARNLQEHPSTGTQNPQEHPSNGDQNPQENPGPDTPILKKHSSAGVLNPPVNHVSGDLNLSTCTQNPQEHPGSGALNPQNQSLFEIPSLLLPSDDDDDSEANDSDSSVDSLEYPNPNTTTFSPGVNYNYASEAKLAHLVMNLQALSNPPVHTHRSTEQSGTSLEWDKYHEPNQVAAESDIDKEISFSLSVSAPNAALTASNLHEDTEVTLSNEIKPASTSLLKMVPSIDLGSSDRNEIYSVTCTKSPEIKTPQPYEVQRIKKSRIRHNSDSMRRRVLISNTSAIYNETPKINKRRYYSECIGGRDHHPVTSTPVAGTDITCLSLKESGNYFVGSDVCRNPVILAKKFLQTQTSISELCIDSDIRIQQRIKNCCDSPVRLRWDDGDLMNSLDSSLIADILSPGSKIEVENGKFGSFYLRRLLICVNRFMSNHSATNMNPKQISCNSLTILKSEDFGKVLKPFHLVSCQGLDSTKAIAILSFGGSRSLNMIPKSHNIPNLKIAEIELSKGSLLVIPPEVHNCMKIYYPPDVNHNDGEHHYSFVFFSSNSANLSLEELPAQNCGSNIFKQVTAANQLDPTELGTLTPYESHLDNKTPQMMLQSGPTEARYTDETHQDSLSSQLSPAKTDNTLKSRRKFLSNYIIIKIVNTQPGKTLIEWIKLCDLKPAHSAESNRQILIEYLTNLTTNPSKVSPLLIEKMTQKLNDEAITEELILQGKSPRGKARYRKTQLQSCLIELFTSVNTNDRRSDQHREINKLNSSRKRAKAKRRSENKRKKKLQKRLQKQADTTLLTDSSDLAHFSDQNSARAEDYGQLSESHVTKSVCTNIVSQPSVGTGMLTHDSVTLNHRSDFDSLSHRPEASSDLEKPNLAPSETNINEENINGSKNLKFGPSCKKTEQITKGCPNQNKALVKGSPLSEFEKPLKTLENSILQIQDTLNKHSLKINGLFDGKVNTCECACKSEQIIAAKELSNAQHQITNLLETVENHQKSLAKTVNQHALEIKMLSDREDTCECTSKPEKFNAKEELIDAQSQIATLIETIKSQQVSLSDIPALKNQNAKLESAISRLHAEMNSMKYDLQSALAETPKDNKEEVLKLRSDLEDLKKIVYSKRRPDEASPHCRWMRQIQSTMVDSDHSYAKSRDYQSSPCMTEATEDEDEVPEVLEVIDIVSMEVLDGISIEIGANTAVSEHDIGFKSPPQPISVLRSLNQKNDTSALPVEISVGSGERTKPRRKCVLVHMNPYDIVSEKLSDVFSIQCLQFDSLEQAAKSRDLFPNLQLADPEVVLLHLGHNDLRNKDANVSLLTEHYSSVIEQCLEKLSSKICVSLLPTPYSNTRINKVTAEFNHSISKVYNDIVYTKPEYMRRLYLEEGHFTVKGIGEKCTMVETFQPNDSISSNFPVKKIPVIINGQEPGVHQPKSTGFQNSNPGTEKSTKILKRKSPEISTNLGINKVSAEEPHSFPQVKSEVVSSQTRILPENWLRHSHTEENNRYNKRKCLLVHDHFFADFDKSKFSNTFDIESLEESSVDKALKSGKIFSKLRSFKPEVVFIHLGLDDVRNDSISNEQLIDRFKQLIYKVLECSESSKVCISLIIPIPGLPQLNKQISEVNEAITSFVTWLRSEYELENAVFTSSNIYLSAYIARRAGSHQGTDLFLTEKGLRKLWLLTRDSLQRTLGIRNIQQRYKKKSGDDE